MGHTILAMITVFAALGDGMSDLQKELEKNDKEGRALVSEKQQLDTSVAALGDARAQVMQQAQVVVEEADQKFAPAKQAVEAQVDSWNARCGGERPEPVYNACMAERGPIEAERERVASWGADLARRYQSVQADDQKLDARAAKLDAQHDDWTARSQKVVARQADLERRIKMWKNAQVAAAKAVVLERCNAKGPESEKACWDHFFDGSSPKPQSCLDIKDLGAFKACLDRAVGGQARASK